MTTMKAEKHKMQREI